jgi:uncharacterized protein YxeA
MFILNMPIKFETVFIIAILVLSLFLVGYYIANERSDSKNNYVTGNIVYAEVEAENNGINPYTIEPITSPKD